ncbi:MAG: hypothetical protein QOJ98_391 [Acidobacteriota bacterium]|nr:hypothetical protein [Acidobacteriota bacterium]
MYGQARPRNPNVPADLLKCHLGGVLDTAIILQQLPNVFVQFRVQFDVLSFSGGSEHKCCMRNRRRRTRYDNW